MDTFVYTGGAALLLFLVYKLVNYFVAERHHARQAIALGCRRPFQRPYKYPFGVDLALRLMKADKENVVPDEIELIFNELGHETFEQNFLGTLNFVTIDPKNIQALLATQFNDFEIGEARRGTFFPMLGNGIFTSDGKNWRAILLPSNVCALTLCREHSRALLRPQFARQQVSDLELEETHVQDLFKHLPTDTQGWTSEVDLSPLFFRLTLDSATEFLFGESVGSQLAALTGYRPAESNSLDWTAFGPAFDAGTMALGRRGRLSELYWLHNPQSFRENCKIIQHFADYYVNLALSKPASNESTFEKEGKQRYVFLHELAKATRDPVELRSQLLNILLAGRDTTAGLLGWTFYCLARDQERLGKLRSIILAQFGPYENDTRRITFESLKSCAYLQHVLSEVLRIFTTVPLNSRRATKDTTIPRGGGLDGNSPVYVRKGQEVNYTTHAMHRRKDIWGPDAGEFKPERWVGRKPGWEFLPFNGGPRICLGQQFALTEAGYVIVRLLQKFEDVENLEAPDVPRHQYSVTTSPAKVMVRLREAGRGEP